MANLAPEAVAKRTRPARKKRLILPQRGGRKSRFTSTHSGIADANATRAALSAHLTAHANESTDTNDFSTEDEGISGQDTDEVESCRSADANSPGSAMQESVYLLTLNASLPEDSRNDEAAEVAWRALYDQAKLFAAAVRSSSRCAQ